MRWLIFTFISISNPWFALSVCTCDVPGAVLPSRWIEVNLNWLSHLWTSCTTSFLSSLFWLPVEPKPLSLSLFFFFLSLSLSLLLSSTLLFLFLFLLLRLLLHFRLLFLSFLLLLFIVLTKGKSAGGNLEKGFQALKLSDLTFLERERERER